MTATHQSQSALPTIAGDFILHIFTDEKGTEYMVMVMGNPDNGCIVRIHSECATGDILGSLRCDCRDQLILSMKKIAAEGSGMLIYMRGHEGRGIGLVNKIKAYALQDQGMDTAAANIHLGFPVDDRDYAPAIDILKHFGISSLRLLTNNQKKIKALEDAGIKIAERISIWTAENPHNAKYIGTKITRLEHLK
ncbi:MAG: GTP cyclohydrolase II [Alphaproteobacteria bacterium]|nr:GTP cyclohydrolase II [Alphaproteobacteria bacterium]